MRVLVVKLSSMGDIIQALPAVSDAYAAVESLSVDWAVDENFSEIPQWHQAVDRTIISAHRRWRKTRLGSAVPEVRQWLRALRAQRYDLVIDAQSNLKSALVNRLARGEKHGLDAQSVREAGAQLAYQHRYAIAKNQLAIDRWRQLFAAALAYPLPSTAPDFGLSGFGLTDFRSADLSSKLNKPLNSSGGQYVFVHNASWPSKLWPIEHWRSLIRTADKQHKAVLLPWGTEEEKCAAESIAEGLSNAHVLPKLTLTELAGLLKQSDGALCMDTGLAHLAAALEIPTLTLYGPTDAALIGATGGYSEHLIASSAFDCAPCYQRSCQRSGQRFSQHSNENKSRGECLKEIKPSEVWRRFTSLQLMK